ncbi:MAG: helix-turn-helix domain-containing protein [Candidatus Bathyarchaeia archaeon]|jgi:predicted transcriptional regulator
MFFALLNVKVIVLDSNICYGIAKTMQYLNTATTIQLNMDSIQILANKTATCQDLLTCLYNLKPIDLEILLAVAKNPQATLDQIAQTVQRDRSSVHRCLSKLLSANLVVKQSKTLKGGGYYHAYTMVEPDKIKAHAKERVKEITDSLNNLIETFETSLKRHLEP